MAVTKVCVFLQDTAATPVGVLPPVCGAAYGANQPTFNCYALQPEVVNPSKVQSGCATRRQAVLVSAQVRSADLFVNRSPHWH